ncbi:MAG: sodium/sugar symporter [Saprospirales bacterium]|nr:sodium/sugar symporter [Saprospirales bacterium]
MNFTTIDLVVFGGWIIFMMAFGLWLSRGKQETTQDYFLASKSLPWWAVGGSLIASNISAEQFIGMSGSGYVVGMAIASYELMAALTLIIVAKYFLPIFLQKGIYTMPQFLEARFDKRVRTGLAIFWVLLFVFVNITSVLYLGGLALKTIMGIPIIFGVIGLALYASTFSIFGGLKAVVWTDVVQVAVLILGGLLTSFLVLNALGGSVLGGLELLVREAPEKFDMILDKTNAEYINLPGISVLIGGMWIANLYYWGNNQYIIQRALAAKSLKEAQIGTAFAAFLKILLPIIVVIPGIAAFVLKADIAKPDEAYPWVLSNYVTAGFKGLAFAALIAAIGSSLSSMVNSASTIFTLDIYRPFFMKKTGEGEGFLDASEHDSKQLTSPQEKHLIWVGKATAAASLLSGIVVAPLLGNLDQAFQYIQEYTGFISPGVVAVFLLGLFWKRTSANAALAAVILAIPLSAGFKFLAPTLPFMDRMGICFLILAAIMVVISLLENKGEDRKAIPIERGLFETSPGFNVAALLIAGILAAIYAGFW